MHTDPYLLTTADQSRGTKDLFTGQRWVSEVGLYDLRNRFMSPELGRFLQPDPIGFKGDASNLYRYCGNNWANRSDLLGLQGDDLSLATNPAAGGQAIQYPGDNAKCQNPTEAEIGRVTVRPDAPQVEPPKLGSGGRDLSRGMADIQSMRSRFDQISVELGTFALGGNTERTFGERAKQFGTGVMQIIGGGIAIWGSKDELGPSAPLGVLLGSYAFSVGQANVQGAFSGNSPANIQAARATMQFPGSAPELVGRVGWGMQGQAIGGMIGGVISFGRGTAGGLRLDGATKLELTDSVLGGIEAAQSYGELYGDQSH